MVKVTPFRKPRRLTPELVAELLSVHASCVHAQENLCPLLVSIKSLTWELNQAANIGNEEDRAFRRTGADGLCAPRPLILEKMLAALALAESMYEEKPE